MFIKLHAAFYSDN